MSHTQGGLFALTFVSINLVQSRVVMKPADIRVSSLDLTRDRLGPAAG